MLANGLQEMLLYGAVGGTTMRPAPATLIKLFPAVPRVWTELVFHQLRTEGPFLVSARLTGGVVEVLFITALGDRSEVEIVAPMGHGRALCVNGSLTSTRLRLYDGTIRGSADLGVKVVFDPPEHLLTSFHTILMVEFGGHLPTSPSF